MPWPPQTMLARSSRSAAAALRAGGSARALSSTAASRSEIKQAGADPLYGKFNWEDPFDMRSMLTGKEEEERRGCCHARITTGVGRSGIRSGRVAGLQCGTRLRLVGELAPFCCLVQPVLAVGSASWLEMTGS